MAVLCSGRSLALPYLHPLPCRAFTWVPLGAEEMLVITLPPQPAAM